MPHATPTVLALAGLLTLCSGCGQPRPPERRVAARIAWKAGDIVFRKGTGIASQAVVNLDHGGTYSHVGIVILREGVPMVAHAVPGEPDFDGDPDRVKLDSIDVFFAPDRACEGAVMRHSDSTVAARAAQAALRAYERHTPFDHDYDDNDTTRLYCTELVTFAYDRGGGALAVGQHAVNLPGVTGAVTFPSDLAACPSLRLIYHF